MPGGFANSQDLVNIEEIRENTVVLKGGRLLHIVAVDGINFALKSEKEQGIIIYAYQNFLNSVDFPLQVVVHSRKININPYLAKLQGLEQKEALPLLKNQISEYRMFVESFVRDNAIMTKSFFVVVPFSPSSSASAIKTSSGISAMIPFLKKNKEAEAKAEEQKNVSFEESLSQLSQRTETVVAGLETIGLEVAQLENEALAELFYNFYNPENVERAKMGILPEEPSAS